MAVTRLKLKKIPRLLMAQNDAMTIYFILYIDSVMLAALAECMVKLAWRLGRPKHLGIYSQIVRNQGKITYRSHYQK